MFLHRHDPGRSENLPVTPVPQDSESPPSYHAATSKAGIDGAEPDDPWSPNQSVESDDARPDSPAPTGSGPRSTKPGKTRAVVLARVRAHPAPWKDMVQVVSLRRGRLEPAAVELAIVMRAPDGGYVHRRMRCIGNDLSVALPYLLRSRPRHTRPRRRSSTPRWVHDDHFDTAEQALEAAQRQDPPAHPDKWKSDSDFREFYLDDLEAELTPEAEAAGVLATIATGAVAFASGAVVLFATMSGLVRLGVQMTASSSTSSSSWCSSSPWWLEAACTNSSRVA